MKTLVTLATATVLAISVVASACTTYRSVRRVVSTTMTERFQQDTVTGRVNAIGPNH